MKTKHQPEWANPRSRPHPLNKGAVKRPGSVAAPALAALLATACGCPDYPCEEQFHLNGWCATSGTCEIDGHTVTECSCCGETPECPLWQLPSGATLTIPIGELWPTLRRRNDLKIFHGYSERKPSLADATVLFNGEPETTCLRGEGAILCPDIGPDVTSITFRYSDAGLPGEAALLYMFMHDSECEATHEECDL